MSPLLSRFRSPGFVLVAVERVLAPALILALVLAVALAGCGAPGPAKTYICPMHPDFTSDRPGTCPICNMDLVERQVEAPPAEPTQAYSCPMHPEVVADHPGQCPICNMDLVEQAAGPTAGTAAPVGDPQRIVYYRNPMDPTVTSPVPAKDSMGMDYLPVTAAEAASAGTPEVGGHATVDVSASGLRLAGVTTEAARHERLAKTIRTVGSVVPDETRLYRVQAKISGWVEKLYVNVSGQYVRRGQPTLAIYSPELLASQQEYLLARQNAARFLHSAIPEVRRGGEDLVAAARRRLELFDVPPSFLAELERSGQAQRTVDLLAPASGYVVSKEVVAGRQIEPGMELFTLADLSHVWVEADFYESEARFLAPGQEAKLGLAYDPSVALVGKIAYIYPTLNSEARTLRVRFDLANPGLVLKPGMFVDVLHEVDLGLGVVIPDSAVLDSGMRQIVFVETAPGRFEPRAVVVLWRGDGSARIASGVVAGERVAVRANFLLDSESRLRAAIAALAGGAPATGAPAPTTAPTTTPPAPPANPHAGHGSQP